MKQNLNFNNDQFSSQIPNYKRLIEEKGFFIDSPNWKRTYHKETEYSTYQSSLRGVIEDMNCLNFQSIASYSSVINLDEHIVVIMDANTHKNNIYIKIEKLNTNELISKINENIISLNKNEVIDNLKYFNNWALSQKLDKKLPNKKELKKSKLKI